MYLPIDRDALKVFLNLMTITTLAVYSAMSRHEKYITMVNLCDILKTVTLSLNTTLKDICCYYFIYCSLSPGFVSYLLTDFSLLMNMREF